MPAKRGKFMLSGSYTGVDEGLEASLVSQCLVLWLLHEFE